mgnify:CR=1 FL=1
MSEGKTGSDLQGQTDSETLSKSERMNCLIAVIGAMALVNLIMSLTFPLIALTLQRQGVDATLIGISTAVQAGAGFIAAPFSHRIASRLGPATTLMLGLILCSLAMVLLPVYPNVWAWMPLRILIGIGAALLWAVSEAWINSLVTDETRGRWLSIYMAAAALGFAAGPFLLAAIGTHSDLPFYIAATTVALPCIFLATIPNRSSAYQAHETPKSNFSLLKLAPASLLIAFVFAAMEESIGTFLPIFSLALGQTDTLALHMLSAIGIGGIVLMYPIGWLSDRVNRDNLLILFSLLTVAIVAGIGVVYGATPYNYVYFFILGGVLNGTYAIGMAKMGDRFSGADLAGSSALMTMLWAAGAMVGPVLGGVGIDLWNPYGLVVAGTLIALSYVPLAFYEKNRKQPT